MVTRISGLASGMDIDTLVKNLVKADSQPLTKLNQQKQLLEWKRDNYRETSVKLVSFIQDKLSNLSKSTSLNAQKATTTGNKTAVTANATSSASGVMEVSISQMATAARTVSTGNPTKTDASITNWSNVKLSNLTGFSSDTIKIGDTTITDVTEDTTLGSFISKINSSSAGVTAVLDSTTGKVSLTSKTTGNKEVDLTGSIFTALKLDSSLTGGEDASLKVNGVTMTSSSNNLTVNGVELTLNSVSNDQATTITVSKDVDSIVATVQSFVDTYNELLTFMNGKTNEERYSKYTPLSSDEKSAMTDDEIELWTSKAKSGMLKNDSILTSAISDMRAAMVQGVTLSDGSKISFADLGMSTGTYETKGKLLLDNDKLKASLEKNPDIVNTFFGQNYSNSTVNNSYTENDGIFARMRKISNTAVIKLAETAGTSKYSSDLTASFLSNSTMGTQLLGMDRRISELTSKISMKETNYYKKFTAMETAINKYNNISSSIASYL
ncbi:flagellar filament capping protein FliD [Paenibacillus sp. ALJ109b]|uniref:flagellar filament capping protein FliD n=1 Tax=Paenibacillus sp. ALJ109b TaxID=2709068 RepID=UPI0013D07E38|nr:flagellar filament capping protein FliD [Paenibacillus sp. ALJ109b]NEU62427.1 flagellar filament capping protein FliD [Paenibacillus sp. ALJ109b]